MDGFQDLPINAKYAIRFRHKQFAKNGTTNASGLAAGRHSRDWDIVSPL